MQLSKLSRPTTSIWMVGLLSAAMGLSACQKQQDSDAKDATATDSVAQTQEAPPMSAEPAEPSDAAIVTPAEGEVAAYPNATDPNAAQVANDTAATVDTVASKMTYVCTPELKFDAIYNDDADNVSINSSAGNVTLDEAGDNAYEVATGLDGSAGLTQWRVANDQRGSGTLRVSNGGNDKVTAYECTSANK